MATLIAYIRADPSIDTPVVPVTWEVSVENNRWTTLYPLGRGGVSFFARLIARTSGTPTRALFICTGGTVVLNRLASQIATDGLPWTQTWTNLPALRADAGALAVAIRAAWPDERPGGLGSLVGLYSRMASFPSDDGES